MTRRLIPKKLELTMGKRRQTYEEETKKREKGAEEAEASLARRQWLENG